MNFLIFRKLFLGMFSWVILLCCRGAGGRADLEKTWKSVGRASTFSMCAFLRAAEKQENRYKNKRKNRPEKTTKNEPARKTKIHRKIIKTSAKMAPRRGFWGVWVAKTRSRRHAHDRLWDRFEVHFGSKNQWFLVLFFICFLDAFSINV